MTPFIPIHSNRLLLRKLAMDDAVSVFAYRSNPDIFRFQHWQPADLQSVVQFIASMEHSAFLQKGHWFQIAITLRDSGLLIGDCGLRAQLEDARQVEMGISLHPGFQDHGYASETIQSVLRLLFTETGTHRVFASIDPRNLPSVRLFERLGFRKEAHFRQSLWFKGEWADDLIFAMLRPECKLL